MASVAVAQRLDEGTIQCLCPEAGEGPAVLIGVGCDHVGRAGDHKERIEVAPVDRWRFLTSEPPAALCAQLKMRSGIDCPRRLLHHAATERLVALLGTRSRRRPTGMHKTIGVAVMGVLETLRQRWPAGGRRL